MTITTYQTNEENLLQEFAEFKKEEAIELLKNLFKAYFAANKNYTFVIVEHNSPKDKIKLKFFSVDLESEIEKYYYHISDKIGDKHFTADTSDEVIQLLHPFKPESVEISIPHYLLAEPTKFKSRTWINFLRYGRTSFQKGKVLSPYRRLSPKGDGLDIFVDHNSLLTAFTDNGSIFDNKGKYYRGIDYVKLST